MVVYSLDDDDDALKTWRPRREKSMKVSAVWGQNAVTLYTDNTKYLVGKDYFYVTLQKWVYRR